MKEKHFDFFASKLRVSVAEHLDNVQLFEELQDECRHILKELREESNINRDTLRSLMYFNVEVKQIIKLKLSKSIDNHHSVTALNFIKDIIECEIEIIKDALTHNAIKNRCSLSKNSKSDKPESKSYFWTSGDIDLVEVVESMLLLGSINNGNVTKKEFYKYVGKMPNVDLSQHNKTLHDIRYRKDDFSEIDKRVRFIPQMQQALSNKLKYLDGK